MTAPASSPAWPRARLCPSCPMSYSRRPTSCTCSGAWRGSVLSAWKPCRSNLPASSDRHGRDATDAGHALARVPEPQIPAAPRRQHRVQVSNAQVLNEGFSSFEAVCRDRHADAAQTCSSTVGTGRSLAGPTVSRARSARNHGPAAIFRPFAFAVGSCAGSRSTTSRRWKSWRIGTGGVNLLGPRTPYATSSGERGGTGVNRRLDFSSLAVESECRPDGSSLRDYGVIRRGATRRVGGARFDSSAAPHHKFFSPQPLRPNLDEP